MEQHSNCWNCWYHPSSPLNICDQLQTLQGQLQKVKITWIVELVEILFPKFLRRSNGPFYCSNLFLTVLVKNRRKKPSPTILRLEGEEVLSKRKINYTRKRIVLGDEGPLWWSWTLFIWLILNFKYQNWALKYFDIGSCRMSEFELIARTLQFAKQVAKWVGNCKAVLTLKKNFSQCNDSSYDQYYNIKNMFIHLCWSLHENVESSWR